MFAEAVRKSNVFDFAQALLNRVTVYDPIEDVVPIDDALIQEDVDSTEPTPAPETEDAETTEGNVEASYEPPVFDSKETFVNYFMPLYEKALAERNLPTEYAKYLVGQIALESGWGKRPVG